MAKVLGMENDMNIPPKQHRKQPHREQGMTLVELMIAMVVLAIGLAGLTTLFLTALATNNKNNRDTAATNLAQTVMEQISAQPDTAASAGVLPITDCAGNTTNVVTTSAAAPGAGATLLAAAGPLGNPGDIDWNAAAPGGGYSMTYTECETNGRRTQYDVRWNILALTNFTRLITVGARQAGGQKAGGLRFAIPVTLKTIGGT